jgi:cytochrome P450
MMEALAQKNMRGFFPTLRAMVERLVRRWKRAAASGEEIEVKEELKRFTVDVTTLLAFGRDMNTLDGGDDVIQRHLELIFPALMRRLFAVIPYWRWIKLPRDRALDRALDEVFAFLRGLCVEARARLAAEPGRPPANFLESMLTARDEHGEPFSEELVLGNALQILLAGEDTTANTLAWAMHHLCDAPADAQALRAEADQILGKEIVVRDMDTASKLAYAGAVANEAMRLRPVAPVLFLSANADTIVGDVEVPSGTTLGLMTNLPAIDERNFSDAREFRPRRWIAPPAVHEIGGSLPFGSGPRICPGRGLATLEMRVVLATLYKAFDFVRAGDEPVTERYSFTMEPVDFKVRVKVRAQVSESAA